MYPTDNALTAVSFIYLFIYLFIHTHTSLIFMSSPKQQIIEQYFHTVHYISLQKLKTKCFLQISREKFLIKLAKSQIVLLTMNTKI